MIGLFTDEGDHHISLSDIVEVQGLPKRPDRAKQYRISLRSGDKLEVMQSGYEELLRRPVQLLPAQPGVNVIRMGKDEDKIWERREPVIAWALCLDGEVRPLAPGGIFPDYSASVYVEMPDGSIQGVTEWADVISFDNSAQLRAHLFPEERADA